MRIENLTKRAKNVSRRENWKKKIQEEKDKLEKYKEIINNEIENLYILNNEKKEHNIMLNIEC